MNEIISVEGLSKSYRIARGGGGHTTFREMLLARTASAFSKKKGESKEEIFWALSDITFEVGAGEMFGIVGRNGAGKSTLLKILSRIVEPTDGRARLRGRVASLLEVGTGFHPELTGRENIYLNGAMLGMRKFELDRKFDEIVDFSGVEKFLDTPVKRYSSGMYVRLAFAVAAHLESDILIVDEVLAVGDARFQEKCMGTMRDVGKDGRTVIFVSHNMPAVRTLCQKAILLDGGKILTTGTADHVVDQYLNGGLLETKHEKIWDKAKCPGNHKAKLTRLSINGDRAPLSGTAQLDEEVTVSVEYEVLEPGTRLNVALQLFDKQEILVLDSPSMSDLTWFTQPHPVGRFVSRCKIPANFLNDGHYYASAKLFEDQIDCIAAVHRQVSIEMQDNGADRNSFFGKWAGAIRPRLDWQTELESTTISSTAVGIRGGRQYTHC